LEGASFSYPGREDEPALEKLSLQIDQGEFLALAGLNGAGKSTFCYLLNALLLPSTGRVFSCGLDTSSKESLSGIRRQVGLVMQNPDNQILAPTVEDDVAFSPENLGLPREEIGIRVEEALEAMELTGLRRREPHLLSVGEKKRLALAGVLATRPKVLVSDESTSMLDPPTRAEVIRLFSWLREEKGMTIIHATHRPEEMIAADRMLLLAGGQILFDGKPERFFEGRELVEREGFQPPVLFRLAKALEARGYSMPPNPMDTGKVVEQLWPSS
jgi:energy-coupling factor transport system ATP-binding protein